MATDLDLDKLSMTDLIKLRGQLVRAISKREKAQKEEARAALEALAVKHGYRLSDFFPSKRVQRRLFQHPSDPKKTWNGRGKRPRWLDELLDQGVSEKKIRVK